MEELKQELVEKIRSTQNENMLLVVKEDITFCEMVTAENGLGLSEEDFSELKMLAKEPDEKDTIGFDEFRNILQQWRTTLSDDSSLLRNFKYLK